MSFHHLVRPALVVSLAALGAGSSAAQGRNVALLASTMPQARRCNDIWAHYHAASGTELALMGSSVGTHIYDCTNPTQPRLLLTVPTDAPGNKNDWRDMKSFGDYAYVVSEAHGGMQIIDLTNPLQPRSIGTFGASLWTNAHNIAMDLKAGIAYVCGSSMGTIAIDVKTNPRSPRVIGTLARPYVHDLSIQDGVAYLAYQNASRLQLRDVTQLPTFGFLGEVQLPGSTMAHSTWPSRDGKICITTNEVNGGPTSICDTSNPRRPVLLSTYLAGTGNSMPHNAFLVDRVAHIAHYSEGYRALDVTDPANPLEIGHYDTAAQTNQGYIGAWGCSLPQPRSGVVYISDILGGLFVLKPRATAVRHGRGLPGQLGEPRVHTFGAAWIGNSRFRIELDNARPSTAALFLLGAGRASTTVSGIPLNVDLLAAAPIVIQLTTNTAGQASIPAGIPSVPVFSGAKLNAQFVMQDAASAAGFSATQGLEIELFVR